MKRGFTLIELLVVIIILAILMLIAVPAVLDVVEDVRVQAYQRDETSMAKAAETYLTFNNGLLPSTIGDTVEVTLDDLVASKYINEISDKNGSCDGYILVTKTKTGYSYNPELKCGASSSVGSSALDKLLLYYNFDEYEEPTTNILPNSEVNGYPTVGNGWSTYNTNQYNNNTYFSIGTIGSVTNNIVTLSSVGHAIYTYDVLTPQTSGGGVTAGTRYFIKKLTSNSFALYPYNSVQDGSLGFGVYKSIYDDNKIAISSTNFPTMWYGPPHLANSALVKEIITDGFTLNGVTNDCIRLHTEHKIEGSADGMAYGIVASVTSGKTYTISFYYRAANEASLGASMRFELYTSGTYWVNNSFTINSNEWKRAVYTVAAPATGTATFYWFPSKGSTIDISEIQIEEKGYATPFTIGTRQAIVNDISMNDNDSTLSSVTTPKWEEPGVYYFDGVNDLIPLPADLTAYIGSGTFTISAWIKNSGIASGMSQAGIVSLGYGLNLVLDSTGNLKLRLDDGTNLVGTSTSGINLFDDNYHYVSATYDSNNVKLYIDGELQTTAARTFANRYTNAGAIGYDSNNAPVYRFKGNIDEVKIYGRALSDYEIKYQYDVSKNDYK